MSRTSVAARSTGGTASAGTAGTSGVATHDGTASAAYTLVPHDDLILLEKLGSGETGVVRAARCVP